MHGVVGKLDRLSHRAGHGICGPVALYAVGPADVVMLSNSCMLKYVPFRIVRLSWGNSMSLPDWLFCRGLTWNEDADSDDSVTGEGGWLCKDMHGGLGMLEVRHRRAPL